tara:strand:- start:738 stop:1238 length:501 start_codon:yes stop_codon:yes gene_type:complete
MSYFLPFINYLEAKKHRINRKSINYKKSLSIAIVYYYESEIKQKFVNKFLNNLKKDNKKVDLYPIIEFTNAENRYLYTFKIKHLNFMGEWKNNNANNLIYHPYDYLIYIDLNLNEEVKNILIRSLAKCRIGFKNEKKLFDLIIKSKNEFDVEYRLDELNKYLKMIK